MKTLNQKFGGMISGDCDHKTKKNLRLNNNHLFFSHGRSAMIWLVLAYLFHTIGELCASPVALSFITKLAPVKYAAFMMGAYFAATGMGNKLAGFVGQLSEGAGEFQVFTGIAIFCTLFGILVLFILKPLKRLTHGAEDLSTQNG